MITHLPDCIIWSILGQTNDIKACISTWLTCKTFYNKHNKESFWKNMAFQFFSILCKSPSCSWTNTFWQHFMIKYGCAYCHRMFPKNKHNVYNHNTYQICDVNLIVCSKCKAYLGETLIHKSLLLPWQCYIIKKLHYSRNNLFENYYGENQVNQCQSYHVKCVSCVKNIRNMRCQHLLCGACCNCKYHKSHFNELGEYDSTLSFNIMKLLNGSSKKRKNAVIIHNQR
jgi:hypothetical protein